MSAAKKPVKPRLTVIDGRVITTSLAVAEYFGVEHRAVLTGIRNLECSKEFHESHFALADCADADGKRQPVIRMTRSGFDLWVSASVGIGRKAKAEAAAYLEAFGMVEEARLFPTVGNVLQFEGTRFEIVDRDGVPWLTLSDLVCALYGIGKGCSTSDTSFEAEGTNTSVGAFRAALNSTQRVFNKNADEFTEEMTALVKMPTAGGVQEVRIFSPRGCWMMGMLAKTTKAKAFRRWVLDVLEGKAPSPSQQSDARPFTNEVAFLRMFYAFDHNLGPAVLLWCLMQMGGTSRWISPTVREIAEESGGMISKSNVTRCAVNLKERGLIDMKADLPWSKSTYFVLEDAVMKLLLEAGKQLAGLPGIQEDGDGPLLLGVMNGTVH